MANKDVAIKKLCTELGDDYRIRTIDLERVIYRNFGNGFDVEISGVHTASARKKANIYLWFCESDISCIIMGSVIDVPRDRISDVVEDMADYAEALVSAGCDSLDKAARFRACSHKNCVKNHSQR